MVLQQVSVNRPAKHRLINPKSTYLDYRVPITDLNQVNSRHYSKFVDRCVMRLFDKLAPVPSHREYYQTILKCSNATYQIVIVSLVYLTRLAARSSPVLLAHPAHVIYTALLMLSFTFIEDSPYHTKSWSEVSNLSVRLLNEVVREILAAFDYRLNVAKQQYLKWESSALKFFHSIPASTCPSQESLLLSQESILGGSCLVYDFLM